MLMESCHSFDHGEILHPNGGSIFVTLSVLAMEATAVIWTTIEVGPSVVT